MRLPTAILVSISLPACLAADLEPGAAALGGRFDLANDPSLVLGTGFEVRWNELPRHGEIIRSPWSGPWWSYSGDGTAWAWRTGEPSALGKYGLAFGADPEGIQPGWACGPSRSSAAVVCETDLGLHPEHSGLAPNGQRVGHLMTGTRSGPVDGDYTGSWAVCDDTAGGTRRCISRTPEDWELTFHSSNDPDAQGWFGHCDGWAFSSVAEPQPLHPVTVDAPGGATTFEVADLEALLAELHACDTEGPGLADGEDPELAAVWVLGKDCGAAKWRGPAWAAEASCRDVDPAALLLVLAEIVGTRGQALYVDGDPGAAIWNYPVSGYDVVRDELDDGSEASNIRPDGGTVRRVEIDLRLVGTVAPSAVPVGDGEVRRSHTYTRDLSALIALDAEGRVVGGEWLGSSRNEHPDTVKLVRRTEPIPAALLTQPHCRNPLLSWERVRELLVRSRECQPDHPEWACEE